MLNFRGYISSRRLEDNNFVDQSVQNLVIRKACEQHGFVYMLSATEYGMKDCYLMLNQVILDLSKEKCDGIAFYSIEQFPKELRLRNKIYQVVNKYKPIFLPIIAGKVQFDLQHSWGVRKSY